MASSGSTDFTRTRDQLVKGSLRLIQVIASGETPSSEEIEDGSEALNMMVKGWQAEGIHLWTNKEATLFLAKSTASYSLGPSGWHATLSYVETTLSVAAASGAGSVTLTSGTGVTTGDNIGIELDDGTRQWTTATMAGAVATLGASLTGDAAAGNSVFAYTTKIERPLRITEMRRRDEDDIDTPVRLVTRYDYMGQSSKASTGKVTQAYYDPQLTRGTLYTWPSSDNVTDILKFTFSRTIEDFDAAANTPDLPQEWFECIKFNLAIRLAPEYGRSVTPEVATIAKESKDTLSGWDRDPESVSFGVDMS